MPDVIVVGAGVAGLTSAVCLAEAGLRVVVWSAQPPERTTSAVAGAMWGPSFLAPADRVMAWTAASRAEFDALAADRSTGVRLVPGMMAGRFPLGALPPQVAAVPGLVECAPAELPAGFRFGHRATVPLVDPPAHLTYLVARLAAAGGAVQPREVRALAEAAAAAPRVVNCTGTGARDLVPDPAVRAVRGQHVVLANPGLDEYFIEIATGPRWAGFFPHGDHIVLGGVAVDGDWGLEPDPAVAAGIVERCAAIEPRLRGARVLGHQVGLRPERAGGVRLDDEWRDGVHVVHNYGHGGTGISLSWGCAREVAARVLAAAPPA